MGGAWGAFASHVKIDNNIVGTYIDKDISHEITFQGATFSKLLYDNKIKPLDIAMMRIDVEKAEIVALKHGLKDTLLSNDKIMITFEFQSGHIKNINNLYNIS